MTCQGVCRAREDSEPRYSEDWERDSEDWERYWGDSEDSEYSEDSERDANN